MTTRIPLFPLGTVLVPGLVLPLHVFEPRYRVLIQALTELPESAPRHFGVVTFQSGQDTSTSEELPQVFPVGCTAELREVTPYADGRFDIVAVGNARFRLNGVDPTAETPYHTGIVDFLDEPDGQDDLEELAEMVALRFAAYRDRLGVQQSSVPTDPRVLSYLVAAATVLSLPQRLELLAEPTTSERLTTELEMLRQEIRLIDAFDAIPAVDVEKVNPN